MNIWDDDWGEQDEDWSGGGGRRKRLVEGGPRDGPRLGATVYELGRGNFMIFHFHHGSEELLLVAPRRGRRCGRSPASGSSPRARRSTSRPAPTGAHEIRNDTDEPVRYVVAGTRVSPEVVEYPDLKQLTAQSRHDSMTGTQLFVIHDVKEDA